MSSTGLITISQRLRGITEVGEDGAVATSKLATKFKEIANIDIFDQYGQLRDTYSILEDMARVFPSLTKNQRQYLSELAAGKRQVKVLESLLTNWSGVEKAVKAATNSAGSAEKENSKYINSIAGKVKSLESSIQKLSVATVDDNFIKWLLDIAKGFVDFQTSLGGLMPLVSALVLLFSSKLAPALDSVFKILKTSIVGMKAYSAANVAAAASTEVVGTAAQVSAAKVMMLQKALGWISLAFTVVSAGIGVWNNYKKAQEDARIESVEAGVAAAEQSSSLDDLYSSIKSLSEVQDRTEEQESSLLQLNSEIIEKLGKRKESLADLTIGSKEYTGALKEQIIEEAKLNEAQLRKSKADAEQALKSDIPSRGFLAAPLRFDYGDVGEDLGNQIAEIFNEGSKTYAGERFDFYVDRLDSSTTSTLKYYDALLTAKKAIEEESNALYFAGKKTEAANLLQTRSYNELNNEISRYSEYIDNYLRATLNVEINNRRINGTLPTTVDGFKSFKEEMLKSYGVLGEYSDEFGELIDYLFPGLSGKVGDATWKLEESNKAVEDAATKTKLLNDEIDSLQSAYKTLESVVDEYNKTGSLSLDSVQSILSLGDEYLKYLTDENGQLVLNEEGLQNLAIARLDELKASAMQETASKLQYLIDEKTLTDGVTESVKALKIEELEELVVQAGNSEEAQALMDALQIRLSLIDDLIEKNGLLTGTESEKTSEVEKATESYEKQSDVLDDAQSAYETLSDAIDEYNKNGVLSVDTLQSLLSLSPEYLQMFFDQAGALGSAEAATMAHVEALKLAKIQELQAAAANDIYLYSVGRIGEMSSTAQSAISGIGGAYSGLSASAVQTAAKTALSSDSIVKSINKIRNAANLPSITTSSLTSGMNAIISAYQSIASSISGIGTSFSSLSSGGGGGGGGGSSGASQQAEDIADAKEKLLDTTMKMIKAQKEDQIEALEDELDLEEKLYKAEKKRLEDQIDKYKDVIDARQKALKLDKEQSEYDDEIADKNKEISDIQNRLTELEFDTSASAMAEKLKLQENLSEKQKDLSESQADREYDLTNQALDDDYEAYKTSQETQIDLLEQGFEATKTDYEDRIQLLKDYLEEEGTIRTDALNMMNTKSAEFYNNLFAWNAKYGDVTNATLQSIIDKAYEIVSITSGPREKKKKTVSSKKPPIGSAITVGSVAGAIIGSLIGTHHDGLDSGFVGGGLKGNEEFIKALKGEVYATPKQQNEYMEKYLPNMLKNAYVGGMTNVSAGTTMQYDKLLEINVSGSVDSNSVSKIQDTVNQAFGQLTNALSQRGTVRKANAFTT